MYASELCQPLIYGISDSLAPAIGFNWGVENYDRVKKIASLFMDVENTKLLELATHALHLFSLTYLVRWFAISVQSFLSAIEKPIQATILSACVALVFPDLMLGALWGLELNGIWLNIFGTSVLALVLGVFLIKYVWKRVKR